MSDGTADAPPPRSRDAREQRRARPSRTTASRSRGSTSSNTSRARSTPTSGRPTASPASIPRPAASPAGSICRPARPPREPARRRAQRHRLRRRRRPPLRHRQAVAAHLRDPGRAPVTLTAVLLMLLVHAVTAQSPAGGTSAQWPSFRGPSASGVAEGSRLPERGIPAPAPTCCGRSRRPASPTPVR